MIFASVNEDGIPAWYQVWKGEKTVTRRLKRMRRGQEFAVQPARTKAAVCANCGAWREWHAQKSFLTPDTVRFIRRSTKKRLSYQIMYRHDDGGTRLTTPQEICHAYEPLRARVVSCERDFDWCEAHAIMEYRKEAHREGFRTWGGLGTWIVDHVPESRLLELQRIEFEVIK